MEFHQEIRGGKNKKSTWGTLRPWKGLRAARVRKRLYGCHDQPLPHGRGS